MALNFPNSPTTGDVHQASNSLSYFFDGVKWISQGSYSTGTINAVKLDSLTSSFNGSLTTFNLTSNNVAVKPANAQSLMISLAGVILEPVTAYTINSAQGTITFASAPASNAAFFGIVYSRLPVEVITTNVSDGVITNAKIASNAAIAQSKLNISDATTSASGFMSTNDKTKLDGIEASATADQTAAEIRTLVENALDSNVFTDADHTKLDSVETGAKNDQTGSEIKSLYENESDTNAFTDAEKTKLAGIEASATADQTASEIVTLLSDQNITTTGNFGAASVNITDNSPSLIFTDSANDSDFRLRVESGVFKIRDDTNSANRIEINSSGTVTIPGNTDFGAGIDVTGNIGASGNVTASGFLSSTGGLNTNGDVVIGNDTAKLKLGTSDDLQIYHDGSNSTIKDSGTGALNLDASLLQIHNADASEILAKFIPNGAVQLYHDGALKAETRSDGFEIKQHLTMGDSDEIRLGNSADLKIYHSGTASFISNITACTLLLQNEANIQFEAKSGEDSCKMIPHGAVELYYDNSKKFETTSGGVLIANGNVSSVPAGNGTASGASLDTTGGDIFTGRVFIQGTNKSADSDFLTGINNSGSQLNLYDYSNTESLQKWNKNGSTELNYDGSKKLETTSGGVTVTGTTTSNYLTLSAVNPSITFTDTNDNPDFKLESNSGQFKIIDTTNSADRLIVQSSGAIDVQSNLTAVSSSSVPALTAKGDGSSQDGYIQLNCSQNSHGVKIKSPPHSAAASYTLTLPDTDGSANQVLKTDGNGNLSWVNQSSGGGGSSIGGATGVDFNDSVKVRFGNSNDLQIYHNGHNIINGAVGQNLEIQTNAFRVRNQADSESMIVADADGSVGLYYNNSEKFYTTSAGVVVTGIADVSSEITVGGNDTKFAENNLRFKSSGDAFIDHNTTGQDIKFRVSNSSSLDTTPVTIQSDGQVNIGGAQFYQSNNVAIPVDGAEFKLGAGDDLKLYHDGTRSYIKNVTDELRLLSDTIRLSNENNSETYIFCANNGKVDLKYDSVTKFETTSTGAKVSGGELKVFGTEGISAGLYLVADDGDDNGDGWRLNSNQDDNDLTIANNISGSYVDKLTLQNDGDLFTTGDVYLKNDSKKLKFGASDDLQIYHSGSHSFIKDSGTGNLQIWTNQLSLVDSGGSEAIIQAVANGQVELYYDNVRKFETTSYGALVTGTMSAGSGNFDVADNGKFKAGNSSDLQIYHDGSDSYIDEVGTGSLYIKGEAIALRSDSSINLRNAGNSENMLRAFPNGAVELYYDNTKRLETKSDGARFTGHLYANDNEKIRLGTGHDLEIYHNGTDTYIDNTNGELFIKTTTKFNLRSDGNEAMIVATPNGAVELKYDNSTKLETTNVGINVTGNVDLTAELNLTGGSDAQRFVDAAVGSSALTFRGCTGGDANHQEMARFFRGGACELNHAGTKKLETASGGVTVTGLLTATASNLDSGEFGMTSASGTPASRFMDFGFLNNSLNMRRTNGGEAGHTNFLTVASSLIVSGDLNDTSDEKLKKNIASITDGAIAIIKQLRPVTFDWIDENRNNNVSGFIAQEVKTVLPNLVYGTEYDPTLVDETKGSKGGIKSEGYSVNTVGITAHLTKALQEAIAKIEILETKVATLEAA